VGGAYVFRCGGVGVSDVDTEGLVYGLTDRAASLRLEVRSGGLAFYVACLRELFEEAGLLIACDDAGTAMNFTNPDDIKRLAAHRRAVNAGGFDFREPMKGDGLLLDI